ncbi:hypothetical protein AXG93_496s1220 [Marchantia polymorpha subsp. ruderalis]|uniref:Uncharacterized protein n=1 Tax=Marchantia polymorpha subsp. ruderalis TaxID=1480154 RepID=A0A176VSM0_MARPO|nr:hypothetical protein AXG93_496s1220 [Marchantia polymorpha subsp. ruderalis]
MGKWDRRRSVAKTPVLYPRTELRDTTRLLLLTGFRRSRYPLPTLADTAFCSGRGSQDSPAAARRKNGGSETRMGTWEDGGWGRCGEEEDEEEEEEEEEEGAGAGAGLGLGGRGEGRSGGGGGGGGSTPSSTEALYKDLPETKRHTSGLLHANSD